MMSLKHGIQLLLPVGILNRLRKIRADYFDIYAFNSYSQEGEDMILRRVFEAQSSGFYVDVGAHHPRRFSNTYFFYTRGWAGINIDAMPGSMKLFNKLRPRDINVEAAVGLTDGMAKYYMFNDPALNTFDEDLARERDRDPYRIVHEARILTKPLKSILQHYLPSGQRIDFLAIDVEGVDLDVLKSNDWILYRPRYILAECFGLNVAQLASNPVCEFLVCHHYQLVAKTINTVLFCDVGS